MKRILIAALLMTAFTVQSKLEIVGSCQNQTAQECVDSWNSMQTGRFTSADEVMGMYSTDAVAWILKHGWTEVSAGKYKKGSRTMMIWQNGNYVTRIKEWTPQEINEWNNK
ncbi:hypothetical protein [Yersinia phage vB_YenM_P778]